MIAEGAKERKEREMEYKMPEIQIRDRVSPRDFFAGCVLAGLLATPSEEGAQGWEDICKKRPPEGLSSLQERRKGQGAWKCSRSRLINAS